MNESMEMWAMLELMGHRRIFGYLREVEVAGGKMLRIDVPDPDPARPHVLTQFYGVSSVYCISPVTEELCRAMAANHKPQPVRAYELPAPQHVPDVDGDDDGVYLHR